jgi:hypothetical protein
MEETKPFETTTKASILKRIIFYLNVSCFRVLMSKSDPEWSIHDRSTRSLCAIINVITEYIVINYFFPNLVWDWLKVILGLAMVFHGIIAFTFDKEVLKMATNYNSNYSRFLFYLYLPFFATAIIGVLVSLNNNIGHIPK